MSFPSTYIVYSGGVIEPVEQALVNTCRHVDGRFTYTLRKEMLPLMTIIIWMTLIIVRVRERPRIPSISIRKWMNGLFSVETLTSYPTLRPSSYLGQN